MTDLLFAYCFSRVGHLCGVPFPPVNSKPDVCALKHHTLLLLLSWYFMPSTLLIMLPSNEEHNAQGHILLKNVKVSGSVFFTAALLVNDLFCLLLPLCPPRRLLHPTVFRDMCPYYSGLGHGSKIAGHSLPLATPTCPLYCCPARFVSPYVVFVPASWPQNNSWFQPDDGKIHTFKLLSWLHYHKHGRRFPKVILVETEQTELQTK